MMVAATGAHGAELYSAVVGDTVIHPMCHDNSGHRGEVVLVFDVTVEGVPYPFKTRTL